jgi:hypothetical protein
MGQTQLTDQVLNTAAEMHSAQDGILLAVLTAMVITGSELLPIVALVLGLGSMKTLNKAVFAKRATELVRVDEIRSNPEYFVIPYVLGSVVFTAILFVASSFLPGL